MSDRLEKTSYAFYKGFLKGLFDADGCVISNIKKEKYIDHYYQKGYYFDSGYRVIVRRQLKKLNLQRWQLPL